MFYICSLIPILNNGNVIKFRSAMNPCSLFVRGDVAKRDFSPVKRNAPIRHLIPIWIFRIHPHGHISVSDSHLKRMRALCVAKQDASRRR